MNITFYFDPSCPFCWITSRWLIQVQDQRNLKIDWQPFSLAQKNGAFETDTQDTFAAAHVAAHRVLRVIEAADADKGELYTAFGTRYHIYGEQYDDKCIAAVLADLHLPAELARAADSTDYDETIRGSMESAVAVAGNNIGVPVIVFDINGKKTGYFGPVLQRLPSVTESLKLWDGLQALAANPDFYELKRTRPEGGPETASTAVCIT